MADRQIELTDQPAGPEGGQGLAQFHHLPLDLGGGLAGLVVRGPGLLDQPGKAVLLVAAQPFADGRDGGGEEPGRGLDAALSRRLHQTQAMVISVSHLTEQVVVGGGGGHGGRILAGTCRPAPPPSAGRRVPSTASD